ncbi:HEAT repeat domain-containing protein [Virgisporangium aurantiacum]|uniref:HEAT repeat domain-containing protein n=1 Tax=Virgisporangium aurantiacum TaxID=175570 RepID=UPI00195104F1|nr:HEAT repeat domain-containing protein [Virgisporangium aurantiacum]
MIDARASLEAVIRHATDLEDDYDDIEPALTALAESGDRTLVPLLEAALARFLDDGNFYGRDLIAGVLAGIEGPSALPVLLRASARDLRDDQDSLGSEIIGLLQTDRAVGRTTAREFAALDAPELRRVGLWALGFVVEPGDLDVLAPAMADPDPRIRSLVIGSVPLPEGFDVLLVGLRDVDEGVRTSAVSRLGYSGRVVAVAPLAGLVTDPAPRVRAMVAFGLGRLADESAGPVLLRLVEDPDRHVRECAVQALGRVGGSATVDALLAMASDPEPHRRIEAAKALGAAAAADSRAADALEMLAADDIPAVRAATISGIASTMKPSALGEHLVIRLTDDPDPSVRQRVAVLARHLAPNRLESIVRRYVDDPDPNVRRIAETELSRLPR